MFKAQIFKLQYRAFVFSVLVFAQLNSTALLSPWSGFCGYVFLLELDTIRVERVYLSQNIR
jgi:hypothetical protein